MNIYIYIVYELESNLNNFDPALENCLFGAVKLIKNADIDKYKYSRYGIGFPDSSFAQNVIISCVSMNNQECKISAKIINIINNEPTFYPGSIKINQCSRSCKSINDPYAKLCVPDVVKNINVKVFNLMSKTNETRHIQ